MNKTEKFLRKLNSWERNRVDSVIEKILVKNLDGLDVKKLKGTSDLFRIRVGRIRILFVQKESGYGIVDVNNRDDNTYN